MQTTHEIELIPPHKISYAGRETTVGATVYLALHALTERGGRMPLLEFCCAVWGREMARRAVWSLCHRAGEKLAEVGYPLRPGTDGAEVVLA